MEDIIAYTIPALVVGMISYLFMTRLVEFYKQGAKFEALRNQSKETIGIRLQAYERLLLFLNRNQISQLISTIKQNQMNPSAYAQVLIRQIEQEFNHNITQQLYVSNDLWRQITLYKETVALNLLKDAQKAESNGTSLLENIDQEQNNSLYNSITDLLKAEMNSLF